MSGGFPHSEISGSKPIPGSPKLIAGYHVLHRLLLPRHPPNALLALDPIQRRTGPQDAPLCSASAPPPHLAVQPRSEVIQFPAPWPGKAMRHWLVYLTWNKTAFGSPHGAQVAPTLGGTSGSDVSLSSQCHMSSGSDETTPRQALSDRIPREQNGGAYRDRTDDPLLAKQMLSQLS